MVSNGASVDVDPHFAGTGFDDISRIKSRTLGGVLDQSLLRPPAMTTGFFYADPWPAQQLSCHTCRAGAEKGIKHEIAPVREQGNERLDEFERFLAGMTALLFGGAPQAWHPNDVPQVLAFGEVLRPSFLITVAFVAH